MSFPWNRSEDENDCDAEDSNTSTTSWQSANAEAAHPSTTKNGDAPAIAEKATPETAAVTEPPRPCTAPTTKRSKKPQKSIPKKASVFRRPSQPKFRRHTSNDYQRTGNMNRLLTEMFDTEDECFGEMTDAMSEEFLSF